MSLSQSGVTVGRADQATTGAISSGSVVTGPSVPATWAQALALVATMTSTGYVSTDGCSVTTEYGTKAIQEWNLAKVRTLLTEFTGTLKFSLIQFDLEGAKMAFGADNVVATSNGFHIKLGAHIPEPRCYAVRIKDGSKAMILLIPNGQVTSGADITFKADEAIELPVEIDCLDDGTGESIHLFYEDEADASPDVSLSALTIASCTLSPSFDKDVTSYTASTTNTTNVVTATATDSTHADVLIKNGTSTVASGSAATWASGENVLAVHVTNGAASRTYVVRVTKS